MEPGTLVFPGDFMELGNPEAIHMALSRLERQKLIQRLAKGIYQIPKHDPLIGPVVPSLEEIGKAIAERERVIIRPTGSHALNRLGISTQVPMKIVYLTNGSRRTIRIGKGTLHFKPTTPKKLAAENEIVFLAIQALISLGKDGVTDKIRETLQQRLSHVPPTTIRSDARNAPRQVARELFDIANKIEENDRTTSTAGRNTPPTL